MQEEPGPLQPPPTPPQLPPSPPAPSILQQQIQSAQIQQPQIQQPQVQQLQVQQASTTQNELQPSLPLLSVRKESPPPEPIKEQPKFVPGMLALCGACGYLSEDFNKCMRCQRKLPENVKSITATLRATNGQKRDLILAQQRAQQLQQQIQQSPQLQQQTQQPQGQLGSIQQSPQTVTKPSSPASKYQFSKYWELCLILWDTINDGSFKYTRDVLKVDNSSILEYI